MSRGRDHLCVDVDVGSYRVHFLVHRVELPRMFVSLLNAANISTVLISIMGDLNLTEKDHHNTTDRLNCGVLVLLSSSS